MCDMDEDLTIKQLKSCLTPTYGLEYEDEQELARTRRFAKHIQQLLLEYNIEGQWKPKRLFCEFAAMVDLSISKKQGRKADAFGLFFEAMTDEDVILSSSTDEYKKKMLHVPQSLANTM